MRDRERLAELSAANDAFDLFGEDAIYIEVEAAEVFTQQKECALRKVPISTSGAGVSQRGRI